MLDALREEEGGGGGGTSRTASASSKGKAKVVIPTPSATGKVDPKRYEELYPIGVWEDTYSYIRFSDTVEDSIEVGKSWGYTMDEGDEEWLEKEGEGMEEDMFEMGMEWLEREYGGRGLVS